MEEKKTDTAVKGGAEERVEILIPRGSGNDDPNLMISVNGCNFVLPRGRKSSVPKHIAEEFYRSQRAQEAQDDRVNKLLESSK